MAGWDAMDILGAILSGGASVGASMNRHSTAPTGPGGISNAQAEDAVMQSGKDGDAKRKADEEQAQRDKQTVLASAGLAQVPGVKTSQPGIGGFVGLKEGYDVAIPGLQTDPNYAANRGALAHDLAGIQSRPNIGIDPTGQMQWRDQQMNLAQMLGASAAGNGPSAAQSQLKAATDRNMSQSLALALGARGGNQLAALKQSGMQQALMGQDAANQSTMLRAQEQQAAQQSLGAMLAGARGQDADLANNDAMFQLQQQQQRDALVQQYRAMGMSLDQANYQAGIQQRQFNTGAYNQAQAAAHGVGIQNSAAGMQVAGAGIGALGALGSAAIAASDERLKTDIESGEANLAELLGAAGAHDYRYKEPDKPLRGHGRFVSPMAQELEQTEIGRSMVKDTPEGKVVDYGKGLGAMLSGLGWLHRRLEQLEGDDYDMPLGARLAGAVA